MERIRNIAVKVMRLLIKHFGESHTELLMSPINDGLFSENWRKRASSVTLSGEMLEALQEHVKHGDEHYTQF